VRADERKGLQLKVSNFECVRSGLDLENRKPRKRSNRYGWRFAVVAVLIDELEDAKGISAGGVASW
jgi:hypothetical protein